MIAGSSRSSINTILWWVGLTAPFMKSLLGARHFTGIIKFNPHNNFMRPVLLCSPFYRWGICSSGELSKMPTATQTISRWDWDTGFQATTAHAPDQGTAMFDKAWSFIFWGAPFKKKVHHKNMLQYLQKHVTISWGPSCPWWVVQERGSVALAMLATCQHCLSSGPPCWTQELKEEEKENWLKKERDKRGERGRKVGK